MCSSRYAVLRSLFLGRPLSRNGRRSYAASDTADSAKERAVYDSITNCLLIYDVNGLTEILRKFHEKRRYAKEFFAKLDADPDAVIENWSGGFAVQRKAICRAFFDETPVYGAAVEDLIDLSAEFTQGADTGIEYLRNVRDLLPEILTDDPEKFCRALFALFSVQSLALYRALFSGDRRSGGAKDPRRDPQAALGCDAQLLCVPAPFRRRTLQ